MGTLGAMDTSKLSENLPSINYEQLYTDAFLKSNVNEGEKVLKDYLNSQGNVDVAFKFTAEEREKHGLPESLLGLARRADPVSEKRWESIMVNDFLGTWMINRGYTKQTVNERKVSIGVFINVTCRTFAQDGRLTPMQESKNGNLTPVSMQESKKRKIDSMDLEEKNTHKKQYHDRFEKQ